MKTGLHGPSQDLQGATPVAMPGPSGQALGPPWLLQTLPLPGQNAASPSDTQAIVLQGAVGVAERNGRCTREGSAPTPAALSPGAGRPLCMHGGQ